MSKTENGLADGLPRNGFEHDRFGAEVSSVSGTDATVIADALIVAHEERPGTTSPRGASS